MAGTRHGYCRDLYFTQKLKHQIRDNTIRLSVLKCPCISGCNFLFYSFGYVFFLTQPTGDAKAFMIMLVFWIVLDVTLLASNTIRFVNGAMKINKGGINLGFVKRMEKRYWGQVTNKIGIENCCYGEMAVAFRWWFFEWLLKGQAQALYSPYPCGALY